jgi:hypothetical protein
LRSFIGGCRVESVLWFSTVQQNDEILASIRNDVLTDAAGQRTRASRIP